MGWLITAVAFGTSSVPLLFARIIGGFHLHTAILPSLLATFGLLEFVFCSCLVIRKDQYAHDAARNNQWQK